MAARSVWKGFIRFSLVSIPTMAYTATKTGGGKISLNQLHKGCGSRIKYQKVCPIHGEIPAAEIVSGYEFDKDRYVEIDTDELQKLRRKNEREIAIENFVPADSIDPRYYSGRTLYIVPDGNIGRKPYAVLQRLLAEESKLGFATAVFSNRIQTLVLRASGNLIAANFLSYASELRTPAEFEPEVPPVEVNEKELDMARTLVDQMSEDSVDLTQYIDQYNTELEQLVQAKVAGQEIVAAPEEEEMKPSINLMEALQRSLEKGKGKAKAKPAKLVAPSTAKKKPAAAAAPAKKRKSG
jgi:DNA end-binding protein Ku